MPDTRKHGIGSVQGNFALGSQRQLKPDGAGVGVLKWLAPRQRQDLLRRSQYRRYTKNQTICAQGARADHFYVILDGWVSICRNTIDGREVVFGVAGPGNCLQVLPAILNSHYSTELKAVSMSAGALCFSGGSLRSLTEHDARMHQRLLAALYDQLQTMENAFEQVSTKTACQRVIDFLLSETPVENGPATIVLPYDKIVISSKLGIKPESLSRVLNQLREWGTATDGNVVNIASVQRLRHSRNATNSQTAASYPIHQSVNAP